MEELEREMEAPGFWDDPTVSNQKMKEFNSLKNTHTPQKRNAL